uniref:Uncharacterized protein n=1 Tax=Tanacetum cinerariifolium TaxID=118510 RepID=A0A6L2L1X0_TANCI|nr:hypothetical protein [Tanacetum cinerariifolium]
MVRALIVPRTYRLPAGATQTREQVGYQAPYSLYKNLGLGNTKAKAMGEVRNARVQISYQAHLLDFLFLDIPVDKELLLLLGHPFLMTCGAPIVMGHGTMTINDGVIKHTYYPKPRAKAYIESFEIDEDED